MLSNKIIIFMWMLPTLKNWKHFKIQLDWVLTTQTVAIILDFTN